MPLPLILGIGAAVAGLAGVGSGIHGGVKIKDANDTMKIAKRIQSDAVNKFEKTNEKTTNKMDKVGVKELEILSSFEEFSNTIEKIQGRPEFKDISIEGVELAEYEGEELKKVSVGASALLTGVVGSAAGTAAGFAAAGATTSAVMALGTASTGAAISGLSGVAATNATLAAIGGGSIAAGGGGMALGSAILTGATLGVGLLVAGVAVGVTGSKLSDKADEAYAQAKKTESEVNKAVDILNKINSLSNKFLKTLNVVNNCYEDRLNKMKVIISEKTEWSDFTESEKLVVQDTVLLVGLLYKMCQVKLIIKDEATGSNVANIENAEPIINSATDICREKFDDLLTKNEKSKNRVFGVYLESIGESIFDIYRCIGQAAGITAIEARDLISEINATKKPKLIATLEEDSANEVKLELENLGCIASVIEKK